METVPPRRGAPRSWTSAALAALVVVAGALAIPGAGQPSAAAAAVAGDGTTMATAGASCWGIKRQVPASPSGLYWLSTPTMARPASTTRGPAG